MKRYQGVWEILYRGSFVFLLTEMFLIAFKRFKWGEVSNWLRMLKKQLLSYQPKEIA